jgi:predicted AAA+ superfamily ATPase
VLNRDRTTCYLWFTAVLFPDRGPPTSTYVPRLLDPELAEVITAHPAVLVVGPRACGKTTTTRRHSRSILRLDVPAQAAVVRADPDAALRGLDEPILIDVWQLVPEILGAVKRAVDDDPRPGRFVLTGSSQADLTTSGWPATGRIVRLTMYPPVGRERHGDPTSPSLIDRLLNDGADALGNPTSSWDLHDYVGEALTSGWPEALRVPGDRARDRWLTGYIDHLVTREAPSLGVARDPGRMRKYLYVLAANTGGVPTHKLLYDAVDLDRGTAVSYDNLLDLLVRILDTLVAAQLRAECAISIVGADLHHLRDANGRREIDLLVETRDGQIIAVEVKATAAPSRADARHLEWRHERLGARLTAGLLVHTGPRVFRLTERILAVPIACLWSS